MMEVNAKCNRKQCDEKNDYSHIVEYNYRRVSLIN